MLKVIVLHCRGLYSVKQVHPGELGTEVGGYLELLPHRKPSWCAYCNEEGRLLKLPDNAWSGFLREQGFAIRGDVCGDVALLSADREGNERDVTGAQNQAVQSYFRRHFEKVKDGDDDVM
jgi:hypothetical protein